MGNLVEVTGCNNCPYCYGGGEETYNTYVCTNDKEGFADVDVVDRNGDKLKYVPLKCPNESKNKYGNPFTISI